MNDLTTGSIVRHLLKTTTFMLVMMVFQTLYFLIDLYWVGRLGKEAVAAVGIAGNLLFIVLAITQMLAVGTTTLVAQAVGRKEEPAARLASNQAQVLAVVVGCLFFAVAMLSRGMFARGFGADALIVRFTREYLTWFIPAMALQFVLAAMSAALRGAGDFRTGMIVQTATVVINIVLAPVLVFGWGTGVALGVGGAALATLIAVFIGTCWFAWYFRPARPYLGFSSSLSVPRFGLWKRILAIGAPAGGEFALMAVYLFIVYSVTRPFGAAAQAGFGIGSRLLQAGFLPAIAIGIAVAPVAAQNYGARKGQRVRETFTVAAVMASIIMAAFALVCQARPDAMVRLFSTDAHVIAVAEEYLRIISWTFIASGIILVCSGLFQAMGNTIPAMIASCVRLAVVAVPVLLLARTPSFELRWLWYATAAAVVVQLMVSLALLRHELRHKLAFEPAAAAPAAAQSATVEA
jgi:putative MATE family efflux protein